MSIFEKANAASYEELVRALDLQIEGAGKKLTMLQAEVVRARREMEVLLEQAVREAPTIALHPMPYTSFDEHYFRQKLALIRQSVRVGDVLSVTAASPQITPALLSAGAAAQQTIEQLDGWRRTICNDFDAFQNATSGAANTKEPVHWWGYLGAYIFGGCCIGLPLSALGSPWDILSIPLQWLPLILMIVKGVRVHQHNQQLSSLGIERNAAELAGDIVSVAAADTAASISRIHKVLELSGDDLSNRKLLEGYLENRESGIVKPPILTR